MTSWDNKLLRKAYPVNKEYDEVLAFIVGQFGGDTEQPIVVVVGDNNEEYVVEAKDYHMKMGFPYMFIRKDGEVVTKLTADLGEVEVELNSLYL